jgi:hypothetical protein
MYALYVWAVLRYFLPPWLEADTKWLIAGTRVALDCASQGHWSGCYDAGHFPLLQRIPVILMIGLANLEVVRPAAQRAVQLAHQLCGLLPCPASDRHLFTNDLMACCLVLLNLSTVVLAFALARRSLERRSTLGTWGFAAVLLFGPFLWYARSSFGEALAGSVSLILMIACLEGWGGASVFALAFLAGLSKETAFPFLLMGGFLAFAIRRDIRPIWRSAGFAQLALGVAASLVLNLCFNFFRYGTWTNQVYLNPIYLVPDLTTQASFFLALLFSPNGGLLFFWPIAVCLLAYPLVQSRSSVWLVPACWVLLFGVALGLSRWYSPFGFICWGPRLLVPWIPVLTFLALAAEPRLFDHIFARVARNPRALGTCGAILILMSFPHAEALYSRALVGWLFYVPDSVCTTLPVVEQDRAYYFSCARHMVWSHKSVLVQAFNPRFDPSAVALACIASIGMAHFLLRFRATAKACA